MPLKVTLSYDAEDLGEVNLAFEYLSAHRDSLAEKTKTKAEKPKAEKPKAEKPKAEKPLAEKPLAEKPLAEKPLAEKPLAEKPKSGFPDYAQEVVPAVVAVVAEQGRDAAAALLAKFGVKRADQVPQEKWQDLISACNSSLALGDVDIDNDNDLV